MTWPIVADLVTLVCSVAWLVMITRLERKVRELSKQMARAETQAGLTAADVRRLAWAVVAENDALRDENAALRKPRGES